VAALVHNHAGRVLLLQREGETWDVPQGAVGPGETVEEAVRREIAMQTGLQVRVRRLSGVYSEPETQVRSLPSGEVVQHIVNCFVCDVVETQHEPPVGTSLLFADPSHLPGPLSAYVRSFLANALNGEVAVC
jgi:ADP-ribose pyrophosphatase YjhB (NUDIX family)